MTKKERKIIIEKLEKSFDQLTQYLLDHTDKVFEEIGEIDDTRMEIDEVLNMLRSN